MPPGKGLVASVPLKTPGQSVTLEGCSVVCVVTAGGTNTRQPSAKPLQLLPSWETGTGPPTEAKPCDRKHTKKTSDLQEGQKEGCLRRKEEGCESKAAVLAQVDASWLHKV